MRATRAHLIVSIRAMAVGQIGVLTNAAEALATAVGTGMLLGSFGAGALALVAKKSRQASEAQVVNWGYFGGIFGISLVAFDLIARYGI